jgi:hypothetical protein
VSTTSRRGESDTDEVCWRSAQTAAVADTGYDAGRITLQGRDMYEISEMPLTELEKLLKEVPDNFVKLVVTSPPYNLGKPYETKLDLEEYLDQQKKVIEEVNSFSKKKDESFKELQVKLPPNNK